MKSLAGKVAVVTGASRGIGKGAALGLASCGATVYITGRTENDEGLPEFQKGTTIHKTAEEANRLGGTGIAHRCDFSRDEDIKALFERVQREQGRLDILVNNAWAGANHVMNEYFWGTPFWKQPISLLDDFYTVGLRSGYLCSQYAAALMAGQRSGLIANISFYCARQYFINPVHGIIKAAVDKMSADTAHELKEYGVKVFSLYPGSVATEGMREIAKYNASIKVNEMETPQFVGLCVAALASDDSAIERSGRVLLTAEVAQQYGFTDVDGKQPAALKIE
ncbi:SDR family NAD(P)-dependent oxidoreductase [Acetanaerobacterium elongatum]|uniref:Dehydrogenase/reductase SDR family member 1 n=1 Tax=Acetanaerobacterium elongatum TaxID=258515 RepID=A0A1H0FAB5_9FIRM|nr:SDR family NAD(P)-dependent oxidoreductase [Acetanaerobacterium elongatum]SDN91575.1 dehydrogenase/reductase SDR family member 1 [Acetanaerobacterium elongatum]